MRTVATQVDLPSLYNNHVTSNISEGWTWSAIGTVVKLNPPKPPKDALASHVPVTFVPMPAVDAYDGTISTPEDRPFGSVRKGYTSFRENDVIFAKITPCMENGKAAIARGLTNGFGFGSTEFHVLRSTRAVIPEYVFYYIRQESFRKRAEEEMTGSVGQRRVPVEFLRNALMPLPPLAEQKRIVAKVEQLLARVNAARERLAKVPAILKRFRQSVLAAACSGRLTSDWRDKNADVSSVLHDLKRILKVRKDSYANLCLTAKRYEKPKPRKPIYLNYEVDNDVQRIPDLPGTWVQAPAGLLCDCIVPGRDKPKSFTGNIPWITLPDIVTNEISQSLKGYGLTSSEIREVKARIIPAQSVIMSCVGRFGISALAKCPIVINQQLHAFLPSDAVLPHYLMYHIRVLHEYMQDISTSTTISYLNKTNCNSLPINVPPFDEQHEIVRRLEALFKLADAIEKRVAGATAQAEKLTQAILAKAFRGKLVPTEAELACREGRSYEPATALLAKIEAQRKNVKPQRKRGRSRPRASERIEDR